MKGLYVITDEYICPGKSHADIAEAALLGGAKIIQLRDKKASDRYFYETGLKIKELCRKHKALFIINDRIHIAMALDADGVNAGQSDLPCSVIKKLLGPGRIVGISASTYEEAIEAERDGADYIGFGPVFSTQTKTDCSCISGLSLLEKVARDVSVPVAAIGGIDRYNIKDIASAGADMACVVSAVVKAENMTESAKELADMFLN